MFTTRLKKEIHLLSMEPPPGVCAWCVEDKLTHLKAGKVNLSIVESFFESIIF